MDEGQRQYMLNQPREAMEQTRLGEMAMAGGEDPSAADQQPTRQKMLMQGQPSDYISSPSPADMMSQGQQAQGMQAYADMLQAKQPEGQMMEAERPPEEADAETLNRVKAMNIMMQQMQGVPQETDQRGAYMKALQEALNTRGTMGEI
jgi:hypothetical protein